MAFRSTSIHNLNGDKPLRNYQEKLYCILNRINNIFPNLNVDNTITIKNFSCDVKKYWNQLTMNHSPSRTLSNLFWLCLPWRTIKEELGEIHIFDTGCGTGRYGLNLLDWSYGNISSYIGVDNCENGDWRFLEQKYPALKFYQCNADNVLQYIPIGANFFMTQSALEHFGEDLAYFKQINEYIQFYQKNVIQIHLMPSAACLKLYPLHGIRQYTPRTISKICKLFTGSSYSTIYTLGGMKCNRLHYELITKPLVKRRGERWDSNTSNYSQKLFSAIEYDMKDSQHFPAFYALIIHSNWEKRFF